MGRPRGFDERLVVAAAIDLFVRLGYEATSVDDLVAATGLHRGSLYKAFGSKRGLFVTALRSTVDGLGAATSEAQAGKSTVEIDLLLVAALELAPRDAEVVGLLDRACGELTARLPEGDAEAVPCLLGRRLLDRARGARPVLSPTREVDA